MAFAESLAISAAGLERWSIVVAEDAHEAGQYAAEELQGLLRDALGTEIPIVTQTRWLGRHIYVGASPALFRRHRDLEEIGLEEETILLRASRRSIALLGGSPRGTLFAVYHFAEKFLGVRFLTADHTHTPAVETLRLPLGDAVYEPPFALRWSYYYELNEDRVFAARLRNNTIIHEDRFGHSANQPLISHSIHEFVPVEEYGGEHPEYFALVDGERRLDMPRGGPQVCSTNPDVAAIVIEAARAFLDANPYVRTVSVSPNDHANHCECARCAAVDEREGGPMGSHLHLVNTVAHAVAESHPDRFVGALAYWRTRRPPNHMRPSPNVQIQFCTFEACTRHALNDPDCPRNAAVRRDLEGWLELTDEVWVWHYITNLRIMDLPFPSLNAIGPTLRYFRDQGVRGVFAQGNGRCPGGELSDLRNYVTARFLWDPDLDLDELAREFLELHYKDAAPAVQRYISAVHEAAEDAGAHPWCYVTAEETGLDAETAETLWLHMQPALEKAADTEVRARVEKAALAAQKGVVELAGGWIHDAETLRWTYPCEFAEVARGYPDAAAAQGVTRSEEFTPIEFYLQGLNQAQAGIPAIRIETDDWRLVIAEEGMRSVVKLEHLPTGAPVFAGMAGAGVELERGVLRESLSGAGMPESVDTEARDNGVIFRFTYSDGTELTRRITLSPDGVDFWGEFVNRGDAPGRYQVSVRPRIHGGFNHAAEHPRVHIAEAEPALEWPTWYELHGERLEETRAAAPESAGFLRFEQADEPRIRLDWTEGQLRLVQLAYHPTLGEWLTRLSSRNIPVSPGGRFTYGYRVSVE